MGSEIGGAIARDEFDLIERSMRIGSYTNKVRGGASEAPGSNLRSNANIISTTVSLFTDLSHHVHHECPPLHALAVPSSSTVVVPVLPAAGTGLPTGLPFSISIPALDLLFPFAA